MQASSASLESKEQQSLPAATQRCLALDAMRGFVMLVLVWGWILDVTTLAQHPAFRSFASQFRHVPWEGFGVWESIQPAFWFVVGASLPFALAHRRERGATFGANLRHACIRALKLILLGQILVSLNAGRLRLHPVETLTHLGVCYFCCFLILHLRFRWQVMTATLLMAVTTGLYMLFPGAAGPFSPADNVGVIIDRAIFGLDQSGRTVNITVLGTTVHMLFGAWMGLLLKSQTSHHEKLSILGGATLASLGAAVALTPFNPVIARLCTASYTFYGVGIALAVGAAFFWLFEMKGYRRLAFPLTVVGMNSIFVYMLSGALNRWIDQSVGVFTGRFLSLGPLGAIPQACAAVIVMWYVCYWLYERKIFFKV